MAKRSYHFTYCIVLTSLFRHVKNVQLISNVFSFVTFFCNLITEVHFFSNSPAYFLSTSSFCEPSKRQQMFPLIKITCATFWSFLCINLVIPYLTLPLSWKWNTPPRSHWNEDSQLWPGFWREKKKKKKITTPQSYFFLFCLKVSSQDLTNSLEMQFLWNH